MDGVRHVDEVVLLGYPVRLGAQEREHLDGLLREFQLIALSEPEQRSQVPGRLLALVEHLTGAWSAELAEPERLQEQARAAGHDRVDLRYPVRPETEAVVEGWAAMLAEVDEFCRRDELLVLARPAEQVALQSWVTAEFRAQLAGQEPTAWPGPV